MRPIVTIQPWQPRPPLWLKLCPLWWVFDCTKPASAPLLPWTIRNRFHNLFGFVIGVEDRLHYFQGSANSDGIWNPGGGWNRGWCMTRWLRLPFISYRGTTVEWYVGWRPIGAFDVTIRVANAKNWTDSGHSI